MSYTVRGYLQQKYSKSHIFQHKIRSVYYKETCVNRNKNAYNYEERKVEKPTYEETSTSQQYAGFDNVAGTSTFRTLYARVEPAPEETEVGGQAYDVLIHGEQSNGM